MKVVNTPNKTNPQNPKSGMEVFLNPSPQTPQTKEKIQANPSTTQTNSVEVKHITSQPTQKAKNGEEIEEIEGKVTEIERLLSKVKTLEFSQFNQLMFQKQLRFKLLMIRNRIYVLVSNNEGKKAVVGVEAPRWGGTSIRYMISQCTDTWCVVVERSTNKGKVLTYKSVLDNISDNDSTDDIFG
jgi:hypothetical protein